MTQPTIQEIDKDIIHFFRKISDPLARFALFVVFFWFGLLKVIGQSPASEMVENLLSMTMPFIPFTLFIVLFGLFEMAK